MDAVRSHSEDGIDIRFGTLSAEGLGSVGLSLHQLDAYRCEVRMRRGGGPDLLFLTAFVGVALGAVWGLLLLGSDIAAENATIPAAVLFGILSLLVISLLCVSLWSLLQHIFVRRLVVDRQLGIVVLRNIPLLRLVVSLDEIEIVFSAVSHFRSFFLGDVWLKRRNGKRPVAVLGIRRLSCLSQDQLVERCDRITKVIAAVLDKPTGHWRYVNWYEKTLL